MKAKIFSVFICLLLLAPAGLAQTPAPEPRPVVVARPGISIAPEIRVEMPSIIPDIHIDLPDIQIAPLPPINIEVPDVQIDGDFWFDGIEQTEREELRQTYPLGAGARVELTSIDGPVRVVPIDGTQAEVRITSYSSSANPRKLFVEATNNTLTLRGPERPNDYDETRHSVTLKVPRRVELIVNSARDSISVGDLEGPVRLNGVSGNVTVAQATSSADISHVSGTAVVQLARLGGAGVRVADVSGRVSVRFMDELNADLQTSNIKGKVYVEVPNVAVQGEMSRADFRAKVGAGGAPVNVSDVTGTVRLAHARSVAELVNDMKAAGARSSARQETARDLALHVSRTDARAALVEALQTDENSNVQTTASRALAPYADEPAVRAAFIKVSDASHNATTRATVMRALARNYAGDRVVRDMMLRALASDQSSLVRQTAVGALAKNVEDAEVARAMMQALKTDTNSAVRLRATDALAKRVDDAEVYALLVETAKNDSKKSLRARALDALAPRLASHPDLRPVFLGYLDDESVSMQYHALKGLVGLNDASLRQRLVDKSRDLILLNGRRNWNDQLVLNTLLLLRKLDTQEADRILDQLAADRERSGRF